MCIHHVNANAHLLVDKTKFRFDDVKQTVFGTLLIVDLSTLVIFLAPFSVFWNTALGKNSAQGYGTKDCH